MQQSDYDMKEKIFNLKKRIFRKLKTTAGMSIMELLVASLILLLASGGLATASSLASRQFVKSVRNSEAEELYTNLKTLLEYELRHVDTSNELDLIYNESSGRVEAFHSISYSSSSEDQAGRLVAIDSDDNEVTYGELAIRIGDKYNRILGRAAYPNNLQAKADIYYDSSKNIFTVDIVIAVDDTPILDGKTFQVIPW